jgi:thiosulfate/3-mercaptopyruvate sulfurtransferase
MNESILPIIEVEELLKISQHENLVIVDAGSGFESGYKEMHLDGALFVDLNTQLSNIKKDVTNGGRHPLPTVKEFSKTLYSLGITNKSHVIVYDNKNGANSAARFWWMLKAIGHDKVQVLNGGFQYAEIKGFPINSKLVIPKDVAAYKFTEWKFTQAGMFEVEKYAQDKKYMIIDVREKERYNGTIEPIDLIAGHIPGAINIPFSTNLNSNGLFKTANELKNRYQTIFGALNFNNIIVHCGSGVTACHTLLAISYAGLEMPKLYVGSWSEWSRNNKPIVNIRLNLKQ